MQMDKSVKAPEYIFIDIFRVVCALLVLSIHMPPFADYSPELTFWLEQIVSKLAVPLFFVISGYFLADKINDWQRVKGYLLRLLRLYFVYTVLYFPQIIYEFRKTGDSMAWFVPVFLRDFFLCGPYTHLWYFQAVIVAALLIYILKNKTSLGDGTILTAAFCLYLIGCVGCTYRSVAIQQEAFRTMAEAYEHVFVTTRNGVFFGFLFVFTGYFIRVHQEQIQKSWYPVLALAFFGVMHGEAYILKSALHIEDGLDMLFSLPLAVSFVFLVIRSVKISEQYADVGKYFRKLSVLIFGLHLFVRFYLHWILLHVLHADLRSLPYYLLMAGTTVAVSALIIWLQDQKGFGLLKLLS